MIRPQSAVLVMEPSSEATGPLMLSDFLAEPILTRMGRQLLADGIQRFFLVCGPEEAERARACLPEEAEVTVSDQREALAAFLNTPDMVLVLNRSAVPWAGAGPGFVYAAPGYELQEAWRERMTNAVQEAVPMPGWLPLYGPETVAELEPLFRDGSAGGE